MIGARGGPGDFGRRLERAEELAATEAVRTPLALLRELLRHQRARADDPTVISAAALASAGADDRRAADRYPLLDLHAVAEEIADETARAAESLAATCSELPDPLGEAGAQLGKLSREARLEVARTWLDDPALVDPRLGFWIAAGAAPILELAASALTLPERHRWTGPACPACGGLAQASVIAEESGEFMAGSPRSLVCSRCATRWAYPRAKCVHCGEDDPRQLCAFIEQGEGWVRIDGCERCHTYIKTFDLREAKARGVVPAVDDVATVALDLWAVEQGLNRQVRSLVGV